MARKPGVVRYAVDRSQEYVPTIGNPGYTLDMVETMEIIESGLEGLNACFIDINASNALARVIDGPISSIEDLTAAEAALQALVFHDHVSVLTAGLHVEGRGYVRSEAERSETAFAAFESVESADDIVVVEHLHCVDNLVQNSNLSPAEIIVGQNVNQVGDSYLSMRPLAAAAVSQIPPLLHLPAYFSDPRLQQFFEERGSAGRLYETVGGSVLDAASIVPGSRVEINLPPLLWILMDRADTREKIVEAIQGLRDETAEARDQLRELDERMKNVTGQAEREETARYFQKSFDAIVPMARQTNVRQRQHQIYEMIDFARAPIDLIFRIINPNWNPESPRRLVNRTITARTFSDLLRTDTVSTLVEHFFSPDEIQQLEQEAASRGSSEPPS